MSRSAFEMKSIHIDNILLDVLNPRIRSGADQFHCINKIILRGQEKLFSLMNDIAKDGLSTAPILVMPAQYETEKYIVKDGNRRITALKLLKDPSLCQDDSFRNRVLNIKKTGQILDIIDCLNTTNKNAMDKEIRLRHDKGLGGIGQVDWSSYLRTIYQMNNQQSAEYKRAGQYLLWAEDNDINVEDEFPITNIARFLSEKNLSILGFKIENDNLKLAIEEESVKKMAQKLIEDFGSGKVTVNDIFTDQKAIVYLNRIREFVGLEFSEQDNNTSKTKAKNTSRSDSSTAIVTKDVHPIIDETELKEDNTQSSVGRPPSKPQWDRKSFFSRSSPCPKISTKYIKEYSLLYEIKQIRDVRNVPLTTAFLLRALIELSVGHYRNLNNISEKRTLSENINSVSDSMVGRGLINSTLADIVKKHASTTKNGLDLLSIDNLQKYLHRNSHLPNIQTINTIWDELSPFVCACW